MSKIISFCAHGNSGVDYHAVCPKCFQRIASLEAALAQRDEAIKGLMDACDELMTEFVSKKRAANWSIINDAMAAGSKLIRAADSGSR